MDTDPFPGVAHLLRAYGIQPKKGLGQNFLTDKNILRKIVDACEIEPGDAVLEIGAGLGTLTIMLAEQAALVITVEVDDRLVPVLHKVLHGKGNIRLLHKDVLKLDWERDIAAQVAGHDRIVLCANLPYYITSPIIFKILDEFDRIERAILMIQKEVADRLLASPGTKEYGLLTVMVARRAAVEPVTRVSRKCFFPVPDVDSAVVKIIPYRQPRVEVKNEALFNQVVRESFQKRRKSLNNVLNGINGIDKDQVRQMLAGLGIDPMRRGETLTVEEFAGIANALADWGNRT